MFTYEPLLHEVIRATHSQNPRVAARFRPFGLETERAPLPLALPKPGRDHSFGFTAPALDLGGILASMRRAGSALRGWLSPNVVPTACPECACG